VDPNVN